MAVRCLVSNLPVSPHDRYVPVRPVSVRLGEGAEVIDGGGPGGGVELGGGKELGGVVELTGIVGLGGLELGGGGELEDGVGLGGDPLIDVRCTSG